MKKIFFVVIACVLLSFDTYAQTEYQVVTVVESIIPLGIGRSRIIQEKEEGVDASAFTTTRVDGKESNQGDIKRRDLKIENFEETKLLNFYSGGGINFQNIASNDAIISSKINQLEAKGWELAFVSSAVESDGGETDGQGIFITRFIFKRAQ